MTIPFVIDKQQHTMADVLNQLLAEHRGRGRATSGRLYEGTTQSL